MVGFETLQEIQDFVQKHQEFPPISNQNLMNPDYKSYYQSLQTYWLWRALPFIQKEPSYIKKLSTLTAELHAQSTTQAAVQHLALSTAARLFIWTNIYGSIHSLERSLSYLAQQNIIDHNLVLQLPTDYFIINGNAIDIGPYSIETLVTILELIKKNPKQIIYIRGQHETNDYWLDQALMHEIQIYSPNNYTLQKNIGNFLNNLPDTLLISIQNKKPYICIRPEITDDLPTDIENTNIRAILCADNWLKHYSASTGLGLVGQYKGATSWTLLSAPIMALRYYWNFSWDAFIKLSVTMPDILQSTITLYNHELKAPVFKEQSTLNCITNRPAKDHYDAAQDIVFGSTMALVRGLAVMGQTTKRGLNARIDEENTLGGPHGRFIRTIIYNDNYTPYLARFNVNTLITKNKISMLLFPIGSPTLDAYSDYVKSGNIIVLFPLTGAPQFRTPEFKGIVHLRASYADEIRALIDHMVTDYGARKFAFFYQNDAYGIGPLKAAHEQLKKHGIQQTIDIPYSRAQVNFKEQAEKINLEQPDAVGLLSTTSPTEELIRQTGIDVLANKKLFGISPLAEEAFRTFIKQHGINVLFCSVTPNPKISNLPIVQEYRRAMDYNNLDYNIFSLESYIGTSLLIEVLKQMKEPITKESILKELESLQNYSFKGLILTFNPQLRSLASSIWIETGPDKPWIEKKISQ
jgi:ABC-type branched-subunit amino acid transport system substrate-binding protein